MPVITGTNGKDDLTSGPAGDTILALAGDDILRSGSGLPGEFHGGPDQDTYFIALGDTIVELPGEGSDTVRTAIANYTLPANVENLIYTGNGGTFFGYGNALTNSLKGGSGDDFLDGGAGIDVMEGGGGNDTYYVDDLDSVQDAAGIDTVVYTVARIFTMAGGIENVFAPVDGTWVIGNGGSNYFLGGAGSQTFQGRGGNETFDGGAGIDTVFYGDPILEGIHVDLNEGRATKNGWGGTDILTNMENVIGTHFNDVIVGNASANRLEGSTGDDVLAGLDGDDILYGGTGRDELIGGNGNDTYLFTGYPQTVVELANGGVDTAITFADNYILPDNVEILLRESERDFVGIGNSSDNTVRGGTGNDSLSGLDGSDILFGDSGNDQLQGGAGNDNFFYLGGETGLDRILDFTPGSDKLQVSSVYYNPVGAIQLVSEAGATSHSANATFLYDTNTGIVSFDRDGTGASAAVQLAQLNLGLTLSVNDFGAWI